MLLGGAIPTKKSYVEFPSYEKIKLECCRFKNRLMT
jgi:hypothetical protein